MALLKRVRVRWASVIEPNTKYEPRYEIVAELDKEQAAFFADQGLAIKKEEDGAMTLRFKRRVQGTRKDGTKYDKQPPRVIDASKEPFTELIGNGSLCNIQYQIRRGDKPMPYVTADLEGVQVLEHVKFGDEFEDEGETVVATEEAPVTTDITKPEPDSEDKDEFDDDIPF